MNLNKMTTAKLSIQIHLPSWTNQALFKYIPSPTSIPTKQSFLTSHAFNKTLLPSPQLSQTHLSQTHLIYWRIVLYVAPHTSPFSTANCSSKSLLLALMACTVTTSQSNAKYHQWFLLWLFTHFDFSPLVLEVLWPFH